MATASTKQTADWFQPGQQWEQWSEFFKGWQKNVSGDGTVPGIDAYQKLFAEAGEQFLGMMQQFHQSSGQKKTADDMAKEWSNGLQQYFSNMFQSNTQNVDAAETYKTMTTLGESMMKAGNAWAAAFQQNNAANAQNPFQAPNLDPFGFAASLPGIGYTREKQDAWSELYRRYAAFDKMTQKYNATMAKAGMEAVAKFQAFLANPPQDKPPLKSLKEVYVKWVDVCENVYAKFAMSPEYTKVYGDTVNALMEYKKQLHKLTDDTLDQLNMPTRKEVDSLHERLHNLRRENLALKKDVAELKKAVFGKTAPATQKAAPAPAAKAAPVKKPAPAAKPKAMKKTKKKGRK